MRAAGGCSYHVWRVSWQGVVFACVLDVQVCVVFSVPYAPTNVSTSLPQSAHVSAAFLASQHMGLFVVFLIAAVLDELPFAGCMQSGTHQLSGLLAYCVLTSQHSCQQWWNQRCLLHALEDSLSQQEWWPELLSAWCSRLAVDRWRLLKPQSSVELLWPARRQCVKQSTQICPPSVAPSSYASS